MEVARWGLVRRRTVPDNRWESTRHSLTLARELRDADLMRVNVVAIDVTLAVGDGDVRAAAQARELLPVVRVASGLALARPDERYWTAAAIAECLLHQVILESAGDIDAIRLAFQAAGQVRPPDGHLYSTFRQLDFLGVLNLPTAPLEAARKGLFEGAGWALEVEP